MPLTGRRILVTRSRHQASELAAYLEAEGAKTILIPTIEIAAPLSYCGLDAGLASLRTFDWLLFTSANAVHACAERARQLGLMPSPRRVAVIGPATARAAVESGFAVDLMPAHAVAESLAEALLPHAGGATMLLVRAETARDLLPEALAAAGAMVTIAAAYRTIIPAGSMPLLHGALGDVGRYPDAVTFTSSSTATNLFALLDAAGLTLPASIVRVSIGPITSATLAGLGFPAEVEAAEATVAGLGRAMVAYFA